MMSHSYLTATRLVYGCMRIGGNKNWDDSPLSDSVRQRAFAALDTALEYGFRYFDHADIYACGKSEAVFGEFLRSGKIPRNDLIIQSKCGIRRVNGATMYDFSPAYIQQQVDQSIDRLGCDYLDVLLLHRPDILVRYDELGDVLTDIYRSGKVKHFGVSNYSPAQWSTLSKHIDLPLVINQVPLNLLQTNVLDTELNWFKSDAIGATGLLHHARDHSITVQAYAPLCRGLLDAANSETKAWGRDLLHARQICQQIATSYEVTVNTVLVAFLLRLPHAIQPVIGSLDPDRIKQCAAALDLNLSHEDFYQLLEAGRPGFLP